MTDSEDNLPKGIGPHEGREFDLLRQGQKDIALFFELEPPGLAQILADGFTLLKFRMFEFEGQSYFTHIVFRDGFGDQALRLKTLVQMEKVGFDPVIEHEIGSILSYTPDQVEAFLKHVKSGGPAIATVLVT